MKYPNAKNIQCHALEVRFFVTQTTLDPGLSNTFQLHLFKRLSSKNWDQILCELHSMHRVSSQQTNEKSFSVRASESNCLLGISHEWEISKLRPQNRRRECDTRLPRRSRQSTSAIRFIDGLRRSWSKTWWITTRATCACWEITDGKRRRNFLSVKVFKLDLEGDFKLLIFGGLLCL